MHDQDTIEVPLSRGLMAIIDAVDADIVLPYKWFAASRLDGTIYAVRNVRKEDGSWTQQYLHRYLMGLTNPKDEVDHKNGNGLDCRRSNMRKATRKQNAANRKKNKTNRSGYKGVCWHARDRKWVAQIGSRETHKFLGHYDDPVEAAIAYDRAAKERFGEFSVLNFPE